MNSFDFILNQVIYSNTNIHKKNFLNDFQTNNLLICLVGAVYNMIVI